ncbi:MAG: hypothetical protein LBM07_06100, partial [Culturomica sp.]|nr:hypothetical protein [Culturomica sp.]
IYKGIYFKACVTLNGDAKSVTYRILHDYKTVKIKLSKSGKTSFLTREKAIAMGQKRNRLASLPSCAT